MIDTNEGNESLTGMGLNRWLLDLAAYAAPNLATVIQPGHNLRIQWADDRTCMAGWTKDVVARCIVRLGQIGWLSTFREIDGRDEILPVSACIQRYLSEPTANKCHNYYLALTPDGSRQWEVLFCTRWESFQRAVFRDVSDDVSFVTYSCGSEELRNRVAVNCLNYLGMSRKYGLRHLKCGQRKTWRPVYWKTLPNYHYIRFAGRWLGAALTRCEPDINRVFQPWGRNWPSDGLS